MLSDAKKFLGGMSFAIVARRRALGLAQDEIH